MNKALSMSASIGNLSDRYVYECEEAEVETIIRTLRDQITALEDRFTTPKTRAAACFKLY
jgi:hypothetical protein